MCAAFLHCSSLMLYIVIHWNMKGVANILKSVMIYISLTVSTIYSIVITEERYIIRYTYKVWRYISLYFVFRTADTPITMTNSVIVFTPMWLACTWQMKEDFRRILVQIIITLAFSFRLYEELITVFFYVKFVYGYAIKQLVYVLLVNYVHIYCSQNIISWVLSSQILLGRSALQRLRKNPPRYCCSHDIFPLFTLRHIITITYRMSVLILHCSCPAAYLVIHWIMKGVVYILKSVMIYIAHSLSHNLYSNKCEYIYI